MTFDELFMYWRLKGILRDAPRNNDHKKVRVRLTETLTAFITYRISNNTNSIVPFSLVIYYDYSNVNIGTFYETYRLEDGSLTMPYKIMSKLKEYVEI